MASEKQTPFTAQSPEDIETTCRAYLEFMQSRDLKAFDRQVFDTIQFIRGSPGRTEWALTITRELCNTSGNLHGGCAATILDDLTSTAALTYLFNGNVMGSVSRTISCTYLKALPAGEKCTVVCEVVRIGKQLWHLKGEIRGNDGKVAVVCAHDKAVTGPWKL